MKTFTNTLALAALAVPISMGTVASSNSAEAKGSHNGGGNSHNFGGHHYNSFGFGHDNCWRFGRWTCGGNGH